MPMLKSPNRRSVLSFFALGFFVAPFLVGFDYPDSTGTDLKISVGAGRYRFTPGCGRYIYGVDFQETELALAHRIATKPVEESGSTWQKLKPSLITFGANIGGIRKQTKAIHFDTSNSYEAPYIRDLGEEPDGSRLTTFGYMLRLHTGLDWRWLGLSAGGTLISYGEIVEGRDALNINWGTNSEPDFMPSYGFRLGDLNLVYASSDLFASSPIASGGAFGTVGIGGKIYSTRIWAGYGLWPFEDGMAILRMAHPYGPVNISASAEVSQKNYSQGENYGISLGVEFRLP